MNSALMKMMPMISCKKASRLMSEGMDRRLSVNETLNLKMHLFFCAACKQVLKQLKGLRRLLRTYRDYLISKSTTSSLNKKTKDKIKDTLINS